MSERTWSCHICHAQRPDHLIGVRSHDTSQINSLPLGTMRQNIRYCLDNPTCVEQSQTFRFFAPDTHAQ